jgi:hypothetical protein
VGAVDRYCFGSLLNANADFFEPSCLAKIVCHEFGFCISAI